MILVIVRHLDLELHQIDVKEAPLNRELDEEINMRQLVGFAIEGQEQKVCKLQKFI